MRRAFASVFLAALVVVVALSSMTPLSPAAGSAVVTPLAVESRDYLVQPFLNSSIWNLPIGASAVYVPAGIKQATQWGMWLDPDVIVLRPDAPMTPVYFNDDAWRRVQGGRCKPEGGLLFNAPIPSDFVVPGNGNNNPDGWTPNYAAAILAPDGITLYQGQPMARCTAGGPATMLWYQANERLDGLGHSGAHGGSALSSIGGTIRLGELVPGGSIRHTMKIQLDGTNFYSGLGGYRWPATKADSCAPGCYTGSNPVMRMGSLLALTPDFNLSALETDAARVLATAFRDYGAYIADNAGWSVYGIMTEFSPAGHVREEFQAAWGFPINPESKDVPWARDMDRIFLNLSVVDNWDQTGWTTVAGSQGALGVGLGAPRVAWAPPLDFRMSVSPASGTVIPGRSLTAAVTATRMENSVHNVSFSCGNLPTGTNCTFTPPSCVANCTASLSLSTSASTPTGTYAVSIIGSNGPVSRSTGLSLTVSTTILRSFQKGDGGAYSETDDSYIHSGAKTTNYGSALLFKVDGSGCPSSSTVCKSLVSFPDFIGPNEGQVPLGSTIVSASLQLTITNSGATQLLAQVTEAWTESTVTWNSFAVAGSPATKGAAISYPSPTGTVTVNITTIVQNWVNGDANRGMLIRTTSSNDAIYRSSESTGPPKLIVTFRLPPPPPTGGPSSSIPESSIVAVSVPGVSASSVRITDRRTRP